MFKEGRKVGRKSELCHWKGFASGRRKKEGKWGGVERATWAAEEEGCFGETKKRVRKKCWMNKVKYRDKRKV